MRSIIIGTGNAGKFGEIKSSLSGKFDDFFSLADFDDKIAVVEDMATYPENALKKARKIGNRFAMDTLADDSGLEVEALHGRPGVFSARYGPSDDERIDRLLEELRGVPMEARKAVFKAYLVFYEPAGGLAFIFYGSLRGYIGSGRRGGEGFGFDPIFILPDSGRSLAEMTRDEKNRISHRGRALEAFKRFLGA